MGNPHCVVFVDDTNKIEIGKIGPLFEKLDIFPERINTEFVEIVSSEEIKMRVWERGSGETLACGTGACASVVAGILNGVLDKNKETIVKLLGGELKIKVNGEGVFMTGSAETVFEGKILI